MNTRRSTISDHFEQICEKHSVTPELLIKLLYLKIRGVNNSDVAKKLGVHRITVQRYLEVMKGMSKDELEYVVRTVSETVDKLERSMHD